MNETPSRILVVDDEPSITEFVGYALKKEGFQPDVVDNGEDALAMAQENDYDLFVLDIMLPGMDGYELCRRLRTKTSAPVLFLSARDTELDKVVGLEIGGDDYLAKPYDLEELAARIEARLRQERARSRYLSYGPLRLDVFSGRGCLGDTDLQLTQKEFAVLLLLVQHAGETVSKEEVLREVWNVEAEDDSRALWTLISRLRRKLDSERSRLEISSRRGDGYTLEQI